MSTRAVIRSWLSRLAANWGLKASPRRGNRRRRQNPPPLTLESLEIRVTPADLLTRLTSPVPASYLATSDVVLTDIIGQLEGAGDGSARVTHVVAELKQLEGYLDHLFNDLSDG